MREIVKKKKKVFIQQMDREEKREREIPAGTHAWKLGPYGIGRECEEGDIRIAENTPRG
jgi:hypothetical protein